MLNQSRSDLAKQELHVESLNKCIGELQRHTEESRLQEVLSMKEKILRNTQIRSMHEMGEVKRAQEQRIDEVCAKSHRKSRDNSQLTSQLQQMQEQMNSMNDPGEFQEVEANCGGRLSHVSSQHVMIPSSRSMLSRDKRLPLYMESMWITGKRFWKSILYV